MAHHRKFYKPTPISLPQKDLLQLACSYGDLPLIHSLLKSGDFNVNDRDQESNCTALHTSVYHRLYGVSALLTTFGAKWDCKDFDGCSVWDYLNDSREMCRPIDNKCLLYSWGNNFTLNLGIESGVTKHTPSPVKGLEKANVKKVVVSKYHSLLLDKNGDVYSCGIGEGGRLGHGNDETYLSFRRITSLNDKIVDIYAGNGHSLFLSTHGEIFSCGLNDNGQLGIGNTAESIPSFSLYPAKLNHKDIRNKFFSFIACGNYHSAFSTERKLYTFGSNFGQLGYLIGTQGEIQYIPKVVNAFTPRKDSKFIGLAASDYVTVGLLSNNSILVCTDFKCTFYSANKSNLGLVYSLSFYFIQVSVCGRINSTSDNHEKSHIKYDIFLLDNQYSVWRFTDQNNSIQLCRFAKGSDLKFAHLALGNTLFLVTIHGEVFQCQLPPVHYTDLSKRSASTLSLVEKLDLEDSMNPVLSLSRFDFLHNILNFYTDSECGNFFVSLLDPKTHLELLPHIQDSTFHSDLKNRFGYIQDKQPKDSITIISEDGRNIFVDAYFFYYFISSIYQNPPKTICDFSFSLSDNKYRSTLNYRQLYNIFETAYHQSEEVPKETSILINHLHSEIHPIPKYKTQLLNTKPLNLHVFPELHDVIINSIDEETFKCHKCVLIARSEYFARMLSFGWQESSSNVPILNLHFSLLILRIVIEYLYTDRFPNSIQEQILYQLLIASDHFLLPRLKDWSESKLTLHLSVDNVVPVFELSSMYNAQQLLITCVEFICINFGWLVSKRELETLNLDVLKLISDCAQTRARRKELPDRIAYQYVHYPALVEEFLTKAPPKEHKSTPKDVHEKKNRRLKGRSESGKVSYSNPPIRSVSEGSQTNTDQEVSPSTIPSVVQVKKWKPKWLISEKSDISTASESSPISHNFRDILEEERSILANKCNPTRIVLKHKSEPQQDLQEDTSKFANHISWGIACNHLKKVKQRKPHNSSSENVAKKERTWSEIESPQIISFDHIYQQQRNSNDPDPLNSSPLYALNDEIHETPPPDLETKIQAEVPKINNFQSIVIEEQAMLALQQYYAAKYPFEQINIEREFGNEL